MENIFLKAAMVLLCYLLGSIPTGLVLGRAFAKIDIREHGSHNIGATNVYRNLGKKLGVLTLLGDMLKGFVPVYLVYWLTGAETWVALAALAAFLGHVYSVYLKFTGGKGVATALGVLLVLAPAVVGVGVVIFILTVLWSRYVSLGSILAALAAPLIMAVSPHPYPPSYVMSATAIGLLITYRHRENIQRIIAKQESKVGSGKG
jgi:acyl phosphate:glycerol-3-phosphate acyltransferase